MYSKRFSGVTGLWWATAASPLRILWAWTFRGCSEAGENSDGHIFWIKDKLVK